MTEPTRVRVYLMLIEGAGHKHVCRALKMTRQNVAYHARILVAEGYIRHIRGTNPKIYEPTSKPYPGVHHRGSSVLSPLRTHHTSRHFRMTHRPSMPWFLLWEKERHPKGVTHKFAYNVVIDTAEGPIKVKTVRLIEGKRTWAVTLWLDEDSLVTPEQVDFHEDYANEVAMLVINEIARRTGARFALPEVMQKSHFALDLSGKVWVDHSHGRFELETDEPEIARAWADALSPETVRAIRADLQNINEVMREMTLYAEENNEAVRMMDERIKALEARVTPQTDPEGMFR